MTTARSSLRRSLAALAALCVLLAPVIQLAHAQAMACDAAQHGAAQAMHHMAPMSSPHGKHHQHGSTCCDLCASCCQSVALPPSMVGLAAITSSHAFGLATAGYEFVPRRSQHVLPFSLAPPLLSA